VKKKKKKKKPKPKLVWSPRYAEFWNRSYLLEEYDDDDPLKIALLAMGQEKSLEHYSKTHKMN